MQQLLDTVKQDAPLTWSLYETYGRYQYVERPNKLKGSTSMKAEWQEEEKTITYGEG